MKRKLFQADSPASVRVNVSHEQGLCLVGLIHLPPSSAQPPDTCTCAFVSVCGKEEYRKTREYRFAICGNDCPYNVSSEKGKTVWDLESSWKR